MKTFSLPLLFFLLMGTFAMSEETNPPEKPVLQEASFGGGCFWCIEPFFEKLRGVKSATSGYQGGHVENPTYQQVTTGRTGHAEVVRVVFDPGVIRYEDLLEVFFAIHDPTTLNRQGNDVGTQYRSVIFTYSEEQNRAAREKIRRLSDDGVWDDPIVTQVVEAPPFYKAEDYHQEYFRRNPNAPYCRLVIAPKLQKIQIRPELLNESRK